MLSVKIFVKARALARESGLHRVLVFFLVTPWRCQDLREIVVVVPASKYVVSDFGIKKSGQDAAK